MAKWVVELADLLSGATWPYPLLLSQETERVAGSVGRIYSVGFALDEGGEHFLRLSLRMEWREAEARSIRDGHARLKRALEAYRRAVYENVASGELELSSRAWVAGLELAGALEALGRVALHPQLYEKLQREQDRERGASPLLS